MSRELRDTAEYERAKKLVRQLEGQAKSLKCVCSRATASTKADLDRPGTCDRCRLFQRATAGAEALLVWEWGVSAPARPVEVVAEVSMDPRVNDFTDWYELNQGTFEHWIDGFLWWVQPMELADADFWNLMGEAMAEYHRRESINPEIWGMWERTETAVTNLDEWYEHGEAA